MLRYLHIENIAVIESTDIDFSAGFNVLTGETGAGKSIIIDSINAILGERTSKDLIRKGCDKASVSAVFSDLSDDSKKMLIDNGYEVDEEGNLLVLRVLSSSGNSVKINGKPASVGILKEFSRTLVNIHGQHDSQSLLNPDNHLFYIDKIAENKEELNEYYLEFKNLNDIRKRLSQIEDNEDEKARKIKFLEFEIDEIKKADIKTGEYESLRENLNLAESYEKTQSALSEAVSLLSGDEESVGAYGKVKNAIHSLNALKGDEANKLKENLITISAEIETAFSDIQNYKNSQSKNLSNKEEIENRLDTIRRLMNKYSKNEEELLNYLKESEKELENITLSDKLREDLSLELDKSTERLIKLGETLTNTRKEAAKKFASSVTEVLKYLDMANVVFDVSLQNGRYTKYGPDVVEFIVKTNVGEDFKPLCKIASGGELSRIMLAIKSVLADKDDVDTLIFDEIDTGISGVAASKVASELKKVSKTRQVICVTHLAQIASFADNHLKIEKAVKDNRTYTSVKEICGDDRIEEIARIMSGTEITDNLYNSAKELLDRSTNNGNL